MAHMSPWEWFSGEIDDVSYALGCSCATREEAIAEAHRELKPGDLFEIIEARCSTAKVHEGSDHVPFLRTRNHEILTVPAKEPTQ